MIAAYVWGLYMRHSRPNEAPDSFFEAYQFLPVYQRQPEGGYIVALPRYTAMAQRYSSVLFAENGHALQAAISNIQRHEELEQLFHCSEGISVLHGGPEGLFTAGGNEQQ